MKSARPGSQQPRLLRVAKVHSVRDHLGSSYACRIKHSVLHTRCRRRPCASRGLTINTSDRFSHAAVAAVALSSKAAKQEDQVSLTQSDKVRSPALGGMAMSAASASVASSSDKPLLSSKSRSSASLSVPASVVPTSTRNSMI